MRREVDIRELQKLYGAEDMVRADCGGCEGCHSCCQTAGDSIVLDPWDTGVYNYDLSLQVNTKMYGFYKPWKKLFGDKIEMIRHRLCRVPELCRSVYGFPRGKKLCVYV